MTVMTDLKTIKILSISSQKNQGFLNNALKDALQERYMLETVSSFDTALNLMTEKKFNVAILDTSLNNINCYNALHSIQNMAPNLPVILWINPNEEKIALKAIKQGAQDYLFKDLNNAFLIRKTIQAAILRKEHENSLIIRANFDTLTGLANRIFFENRLDIALQKVNRVGNILSIMFLDLDKFKQINDTLGHAAGDKLLIEVSQRLRMSLRPYDIAARFGGDEFAILFEDIFTYEQSKITVQKILEMLRKPFHLANNELFIQVSIGVANYETPITLSREAILEQADAAMYMAKSHKGDAYYMLN